MAITLREIAEIVDGRLEGDGALLISGAAIIRDAQPGDITLADDAKLAPQLAASHASAALVGRNYTPLNMPFVAVDNVHRAFAAVLARLRPEHANGERGIDPGAEVHPTAIVPASAYVAAGAKIGPHVVLGEHVSVGPGTILHAGVQILHSSQLGADCEIFPNVVLYENTKLGDRVVIHAGAVIGAYGFGYDSSSGSHQRSAQLGNVEIESDVEIGACTTIDRGTYGPTRIGEGTKIDNQVMIAHNCRIGRHNLICSHVGIAGSCTTGDYVVMAGQVGLRDHVQIGDRVTLGAKSGVMHDVPAGSTLVGAPAIPVKEQMLIVAASFKLPEMRKQLKALERTVEMLQQRLAAETTSEAAPPVAIPLRESA
jgi:UDP-3-O-[3-hydroxymyristoyl] glucosamine N-acyltransferase